MSSNAVPIDQNQILFAVPIGPDGVSYADRQDQQKWGPTAIATDADGSIWIVDSASDRVVHYRVDGEQLGSVDLDGRAVGLTDLALSGQTLALLDIGTAEATVLRIDKSSGATLSSSVIPRGSRSLQSLRHIWFDAAGELLADLGLQTISLDSPNAVARDGRPGSHGWFQVEWPDLSKAVSQATVIYRGSRFDVQVANTLAGIYFLGDDPSGILILVDELSQDSAGVIQVDRTVRRLTADGRQVAIGRVPLSDGVYIPNSVSVSRDGSILALVAHPRALDIVRIEMGGRLVPILESAARQVGSISDAAPSSITSCRSRSDMMTTAAGYTNNIYYLSDTNIDAGLTLCSGRQKPRYLAMAGYWSSVSYDWGGWETVAQFNSFMSAGKQAGDYGPADYTVGDCGKGVDCSGFVTRVWGLSSKYSTSMLPSISTAISESALQPGDIFNNAGSHVVLFASRAGSGYNVYDSTEYANLDRVVYHTVDASYVSGYSTRKYNDVCP